MIKDLTDEQLEKQYNQSYVRWNIKGLLKRIISDKEHFMSDTIHELLTEYGEPQPMLLKVEEDWL